MKNSNAIHETRKQPGKPLLSPRKQVYVYHWDRIIGAGVVFLVLCGLAAYGLYLWSDSSPKEEFDIAETLTKAEVVVENTRPRLEEEPIHRDIEEDPRSFTHAEKDKVEETLVNEMDLEGSEPANGAQPSEEMLAIPTHEELSEPQTGIPQNIPLAPQESPDNADTMLTVDTLNSPFQLKQLEIFDPSVKRFLLARSVSNREPVGELNEISFTADGSAAVWVYSELIDKKGSRFKYVWLHDGNQVVTVAVNVGGNRWRSYSSKLINQSMSGAWRVELQDGEGRLMASADFFLE